jgi:D-amino-acid dehydrogenase
MKIAVVGGGVIGLACARRLARAGAAVTVLERERCGQAASLGNAGWVTPVLSAPLPGPGVLSQALRWMLDPASPLLIRPRLDPVFASWCFRFARNCTSSRFAAGARALLALNARTLQLFDALRSEGLDFEMQSTGLIIAALSEDELGHEWELLTQVRDLGYAGPLELLDSTDVHRLEPVLARDIAGGIYAADERHVRPEALTAALAGDLRNGGADLREGVSVTGIVPSGGGWSVRTSGGESVAADRVVVAAGVWTRRLLEQLGTRLPLEGGKGYSVTAAVNGRSIQHAVMLHEARVGCSPYAGGLRLAGTLELAGESLVLNRRRLDAIADAGRRYLDFTVTPGSIEWAGLRPLLPDGLPVIGRVPDADGRARHRRGSGAPRPGGR